MKGGALPKSHLARGTAKNLARNMRRKCAAWISFHTCAQTYFTSCFEISGLSGEATLCTVAYVAAGVWCVSAVPLARRRFHKTALYGVGVLDFRPGGGIDAPPAVVKDQIPSVKARHLPLGNVADYTKTSLLNARELRGVAHCCALASFAEVLI